jgi:predicted dehydrogenase
MVSPMGKVRWGVLGVAKIATEKVIPAMRGLANCEVVAIASRDAAKAAEAARVLGIARSHGSYEALVADPDVDAIYIPLPNHLHVEWTTRAAEAGKHVLCEKPIGFSAADAAALIAVRDRTRVAIGEAFMYRTHPQWRRVVEIVRSGRLGEVRAIAGAFSYFNDDPTNIRNVAEWGGGALYDIGCYLINSARLVFNAEPRRVAAIADRDPSTGVDRLTSMLFDFPSGQAIGVCGTQHVPYQRINIFGTRSRLEVEIPFNAPHTRPARIFLDDELIELPTTDQYTVQADEFSAAIIAGRPAPYPLEDTLNNMRVIDAVFEAAASGQWTEPRG